nr:retrovirus-related Pol polyprotein from transposon TNT 1-94 [Tanacetum cinerariifolium]
MFKVKEDQNGMKRYKARFVVKGFQQKRRADYNEIFSSVVKITTIRLRIPEEEWRGKDTSLVDLKSPGESSDTSEGSENSKSFKDSRRSDEKYSKDRASSEEGGSDTPQVRRSTRESRASVKEDQNGMKRYKARFVVKGFQQKRRADYNEIFSSVVKMTTIRDVHWVGDEREVKVLRSFNWPPSELITDDGVLSERGTLVSGFDDFPLYGADNNHHMKEEYQLLDVRLPSC